MKSTYALVADSTRARFFVADSPRGPMREIEDLVQPSGRLPGRELRSDSPGRSRDRAGPGRHSLEPPTDPRDAETQDFVRRVAHHLQHLHEHSPANAIILVAAPDFLGMLRKQLRKQTMVAVVRQIDKNVVSQSVDEISKLLGFAQ